MLTIPAPRLLPMTIAMLAVLLLVKSAVLLEIAVAHGGKPDSVIVTAANAASTERSPDAAPERARPQANAPPHPSEPKAADPKPDPTPSGPTATPAVSDSERALLQDLRQRRKDLDTRAEAVAARESMLAAAEQKIAERVTELQALQQKLEGLNAAQKQKEDAGWQGLVRLYEAMKPKDAAAIFNDLQMPVLLQVLDRMKDAKAAAVMAAMNPDRARDVTAELAQMRTGKDAAQSTPSQPRTNSAGG
jgi:flagellar motility protein MotE (MotC chaperone)